MSRDSATITYVCVVCVVCVCVCCVCVVCMCVCGGGGGGMVCGCMVCMGGMNAHVEGKGGKKQRMEQELRERGIF